MKLFLFFACLPILALISSSLKNENYVKEFYLNWKDKKETPAEWFSNFQQKENI